MRAAIDPNRPARTQRQGLTDRVYENIKALVSTFRVPPGAKLSESELAAEFGVSRTPVREALNRLLKEGFLTFAPNRGFHCRLLDAREIFDLYEVRLMLETNAVRLAAERARNGDLNELEEILRQSSAVPEDGPVDTQLDLDEEFHEGVAQLSGNKELTRMLVNINARIRFTRLIDMIEGRRSRTQAEHRRVLQALQRRDAARGIEVMQRHIARRLDQIVVAIGKGYARMHMNNEEKASGGDLPSTLGTPAARRRERPPRAAVARRRSRAKASSRRK
jgi:DNA-binding GntR family transcriptional regulator